jgi:hypothetical protein
MTNTIILFICISFNGAIDCLDYIALTDMMTGNDVEGHGHGLSKELSWNFSGGNENHENLIQDI